MENNTKTIQTMKNRTNQEQIRHTYNTHDKYEQT